MEVLELAKDRTWLAKVTNTVSQHWKGKNLHKKGCFPGMVEMGRVDAAVASRVHLRGAEKKPPFKEGSF
jgi:hypothetical protein